MRWVDSKLWACRSLNSVINSYKFNTYIQILSLHLNTLGFMSIPTLVLDLSIFESIRPPWLQEPLCLLWLGIEQDYPTRMCPLNLQGSYFTHIRIFFFMFLFFLLLLEWTFQTFLCFHPSAQTPPEWPQITAMPTLVFNPMSCHSTKFKPVYKAASEDPSSTLPPYNLPAL